MTRRDCFRFAAAAAAGAGAGLPAAALPPNIILILTDDQGWTGTSVRMDDRVSGSASDYYRTPHIERLARSGMRFSSGYAAAPICSPTRYSIQFGQTPARLRMTQVDPELGRKVDHSQLTIPKLLKRADGRYAAAHFGKWHIECDQADMGYDAGDGRTGNTTGGMSQGAARWKPRTEEDPKRIFGVTSRSQDFIEKQVRAGRPFYLQVSHYAVHADIVSRQATAAKYEKLPKGARHNLPGYAAMTEDLDTGIGQLLDTVRSLGIADRTYIFLTADNGAVPVIPPDPKVEMGQNHPLRRGKWSLLEGGIRVPFLAAGPGIRAGAQCDIPVASWDLLPTFGDLAGSRGPLPPQVDGVSIRSLLFSGNGSPAGWTARPLVFHLPHSLGAGLQRPHSAIRDGAWKLIRFLDNGQLMLFDLSRDLSESVDLAEKMPERARGLERRLLAYLAGVKAQLDTKASNPPFLATADTASRVAGNGVRGVAC